MSDKNQNDNDRTGKLIRDAVALTSARAVDEHLRSVESARRLALDQQQEDMQTLRDEIIESQQRSFESQQKLIEQMTEILSFFREFLPNPVNVNVPETRLTLTQQPVTVNVPKASIAFNPNVMIPEIVIPERKMPERATIKHSDGSMSTVEFGR
jgi:hypothetical protein